MLSISNRMSSNITSNRSEHRFATLWHIVLDGGTVYRFTDHNEILNDGTNNFTPAAAFNASAREMQDGLQINDIEVAGFLSSAGITSEDLRAGLWRNAQISEKIVDWRYPWAGDYGERSYSVSDIEWAADQWVAQLEGVGRKLRRKIGNTMGRMCRFDLGDADCGITIASFTDSGTVTAADADSPRKRLIDTALRAGHADGYYEYGLIVWTGGSNTGLKGEVHKWTTGDGQLILRLPMPYDIEVGDTFDIYPGCGKLTSYCKGTEGDQNRPWANNIAEFGGFPFIPGTDRMLQYPDARN